MIELRHVRKEFPDIVPIRDVSLKVENGEVVSLIGPSGTGKSTLLRMINMLTKPTSGQIFIDGEEITRPGYPLHTIRGKVAMVFQSFNLFNNMTVIENVCYAPVRLKHAVPSEAYEKGMKLLERVGLERAALKYPDQLSGGQKQRVAIARTLAVDPDVILFDEPTSALDPLMVGEVEKVIEDLCKEGYTILLVTHDMQFAEKISTRVIYLDEGGVYEDGTPDQIFNHPQGEKTRAFVRQLKEIECVLDSDGGDFIAFYTKLDNFAFKNDIPAGKRRNIQSLFEELCYQILLPKRKGTEYSITFRVSYSSHDRDTEICIVYDGAEPDPDSGEDAISWNIVRHCAENIRFCEENGRKVIRCIVK